MIRELCALCGEDLDERGRRRCDCRPKQATHLGRVVLAATRVAAPDADLETLRRYLRGAAFHLREGRRPTEETIVKNQTRSTTVVESRSNRMGIEVRLERFDGRCMLRAYHVGDLAAEREVTRTDKMALGKTPEILVVGASVELRTALTQALDEGVRALRDGRGLCEAA